MENHYPSSSQAIGIGKKVVITGVVVSCVTLFLPCLLVISALVLACCVPSGVVFATYVCTQNLMRKLLPSSETFNQHELESGFEEEEEDIKQMDHEFDARGKIEEEEGYNNNNNNLDIINDVVKNIQVGGVDKEKESSDEKPSSNGKNLSQEKDEKINTGTKDEKEKEKEQNDKIITEETKKETKKDGQPVEKKQRKKKRNGGGGKKREAEADPVEHEVTIDDEGTESK